MYRLSMDDTLLVTKICAHVMGDKSISLTKADKEATRSLIKKMVDHRYDWTPDQREQFKCFTDIVIGLCKTTDKGTLGSDAIKDDKD